MSKTRQNLGRIMMVNRGQFNASVKYENLDVVTYNGSSYMAITDTTGNLPTNENYFKLIAAKGDTYEITEADKTEIKNDIVSDATNDFNKNISNKTDEFNANATEKNNTYNSNAESKLNAYNTNDTAKTKTYNDNATSKLEEYNENSNTKLSEYNDNATLKVNEFNETVEDLREENKQLYSNQLVNSAEDEEIYLEDSAEMKLKDVQLYGKLEQNVTQGYNMLPNMGTTIEKNGVIIKKNDDGTLTINGTATSDTSYDFIVPKNNINIVGNGTLYIKAFYENNNSENIVVDAYNNWEDRIAIINGNNKILIPEAKNYNRVRVYCKNGKKYDNARVGVMIAEKDFDIYEPYTGGQPSPSPDYPQDIKVVTGDVEIKVQNKNLFDKTKVTQGYLTSSGTVSYSANTYVSEFINISNYTYLSRKNTGDCCFYDEEQNFISKVYNKTYTRPENATYIRIQVSTANLDNEQLERGTTATSYVEHQEQTYPLSLGDIELCEGEYFFKENGKWYKHNKWEKIVLDGSESWVYDTNYKYFRCPTYDFGNKIPAGAKTQYSNYFIGTKEWGDGFRDATDTNEFFYFSNNGYKICVRNINITDVDAWKTWLSENTPIVYYQLATKTDTEITDETLILQLNDLLRATTYSTVTNIDTETENLKPIIKLEYYKDLNKVITDMQAMIVDLSTN